MNEEFYKWFAAALPELKSKRVLLGFDGFVDRPARIPLMKTMKAFSTYLAELDGMSGILDIEEMPPKLGGNMPITANALGQLGISVDCIGALDDPLFDTMSPRCTLHPVAPPGKCLALEFESGKLMLSGSAPIQSLDFSVLEKKITIPELIRFHNMADLWGYFNWSELTGMTDILSGLLSKVLPALPQKSHANARIPKVFFDLSDCTARSKDDIKHALDLMAQFSIYGETILSLNENEACQLLRIYQSNSYNLSEESEIRMAAESLYKQLRLNNIVIRKNRRAYAINAHGFTAIDTLFVENPKLMTGAGDNFNAGIIAAQLLGADWAYSLTLGTVVSSSYIESAESPTSEILTSCYSPQ